MTHAKNQILSLDYVHFLRTKRLHSYQMAMTHSTGPSVIWGYSNYYLFIKSERIRVCLVFFWKETINKIDKLAEQKHSRTSFNRK